MTAITLTGLDAKSLPLILKETKDDRSGWVEFGILWSASQEGLNNRYPELSSIAEFSKRLIQLGADRPFNFALHVCGARSVLQLMEGAGLVTEAAAAFDRVQINFSHEHATHLSLSTIRNFIQGWPKPVIFQMHGGNANLFEHLQELSNVHALIDGSGGRGISPKEWRPPVEGFHTGFAGGLGPWNLAQEMTRIDLVCSAPYWVDMEGKLRDDDDWFSLERANQCIEIVSKHRQENARVERPIPG